MMRGSGGSRLDGQGRAAPRQVRATASDTRVWIGVVLLVGSVVVGTLVVARPTDSVLVWRATRDLAEGAEPVGLEPASVPADMADGTYLATTSAPQGRLRWPLPAGSLVPVAALDVEGRPDLRRVTVPVDPLHAPIGLLPGAVVDVWWTADDRIAAAGVVAGSGAAPVPGSAGPALVRAATVVADVTADPVGFGSAVAVVLEVPAKDVGTVVAAAGTGRIDLVAVAPAPSTAG